MLNEILIDMQDRDHVLLIDNRRGYTHTHNDPDSTTDDGGQLHRPSLEPATTDVHQANPNIFSGG